MIPATAREYSLPELLECAGARLRARNRADCPRCGARRTVSYTGEAFCCHHARCDFRGNVFTLAKQLGFTRRLPRAEYLAEKRAYAKARRTAEVLAERVNERLKDLAQAERILCRAEATTHDAGNGLGSWDVLAAVYDSLPRVRGEWTLLSYAPALAVMEFLASSPEAQDDLLGAVIALGGVYEDAGRFVEVPL